MKLNRLFLDLDTGEGWLWNPWLRVPIWKDGWLWDTNPLWDDLLPLVRMEAKRLGGMYPLGNIAIINRSDDGYHIKYPQARLSKDEELAIMWASMGHRGHIMFSQAVQDTTIRVSKKRGNYSHEPYLVEVLKVK